ncbi:MAG: hypothetical protein P8Y28_05400 [Gammaproteobacteria bacterium]
MIFKSFGIKLLATLVGTAILLTPFLNAQAEEGDWQMKGTLQSYFQTYDGSLARQGTYNAGAYLNADYLDSGSLDFGYNYTFVDFENNVELTENLFYLSGRYHLYLDALPGKLTLRLDGYLGDNTMEYSTNTGGGGMGGGGTTATKITETTDITAYQPQLAFINHSKTFYADIGYAYSEYDGTAKTEVDQFTPTIGFGWNESYDWLQLRGYLVKIDESVPVHADDQFDSLEVKYTHWFADSESIDYLQITGLFGERLLAVDPDAAVIYSTADKQTGSLSGSMQWKLSKATRMLALVTYGQHEHESINDEYDSLLFYLNLQFQW